MYKLYIVNIYKGYINSPSLLLFTMPFIYLFFCPILHPFIHSKPPLCVLFTAFSHPLLYSFSIRSFLFLPCVSFLFIVQLCFPVSRFILFWLGSILPPIVLTLWLSLLSHMQFGNREADSEMARSASPPSLVKSHFLFPPRSASAGTPGKHKASYEKEAQGQQLILKTVLIYLCLISLMLMLEVPRLLTKLGDVLFDLAWGLSDPKMRLTVQATFRCWFWPFVSTHRELSFIYGTTIIKSRREDCPHWLASLCESTWQAKSHK